MKLPDTAQSAAELPGFSKPLSIIVVTFNSSSTASACLRTLTHNNLSADDEVIVIDNGSTDGTVETLRSVVPSIRVISQQVNTGFAAAVNAGTAVAQGRFLLFLNPDTNLQPETLPRAVAYLEQHPEYALLGARFVNPDNSPQRSARSFPTLWSVLGESFFLHRLVPRFLATVDPWVWGTEAAQEVDVVKGAFFLVRHEAWRSVGPFDEQFFVYSEEQDWCRRAKTAGHRIVYVPSILIPHAEGSGVNISWKSGRLLIYDSEFKYFRKYYGVVGAVLSRVCLFPGILLRIMIWSVLASMDAVTRNSPNSWNRLKYFIFALVRICIPPLSPSELRTKHFE